jgi:hypothetical protein
LGVVVEVQVIATINSLWHMLLFIETHVLVAVPNITISPTLQ